MAERVFSLAAPNVSLRLVVNACSRVTSLLEQLRSLFQFETDIEHDSFRDVTEPHQACDRRCQQ
jgi:hypothetical protein